MRPALAVLPFALLLAPTPAFAKDLRSRAALGFAAQFGDIAALSFRYGLPTGDPKVNVQIEADAGAAFGGGGSTDIIAGGRLLYGVVAEDNLNLYLVAGGAYVMGGSASFVRLQPAISAQFFLFGVENLGFSAEWGVNIDLGAAPGVKTVAGAPGAAVHYYF